jgi:two-component system chemotaxis response regulator CheB
MVEQQMEDSGDPGYLADDEARLTRLRCPECGGPLAQLDLPAISYYRCHVGHQYAPQSLEAAQRETAEAKLWTAVAALEEHAALAAHLAEHAERDDPGWRRAAERSAALAKSVRGHLIPPSQTGSPAT